MSVNMATKGMIGQPVDTGFPTVTAIKNAVWNTTASDHTNSGSMGDYLRRIKMETSNKMTWDSANSRFIIYKDDDTTVLGYMDVTDKDGNAVVMQGTGPASRIRVQ